MLKFGTYEIGWADIAYFNPIAEDLFEVAVTTSDAETYVVKTFDTAAKAVAFRAALVNLKTTSDDGGIVIEIIIDDL
jgi:hypothetical protein